MKKEINPTVAIAVIVAFLLIAGGAYYMSTRDRGPSGEPAKVNGHKATPQAGGGSEAGSANSSAGQSKSNASDAQ